MTALRKLDYPRIKEALANHGLVANDILAEGWDHEGYYRILRGEDGKALRSEYEENTVAKVWEDWPSRKAYEDFYAAWIYPLKIN